ncbi:MAG: hypothetical protein L3J74_00610 [Bacteroidales bacterium]|nr:hypothetical protein [Bacteroidales bacterium]
MNTYVDLVTKYPIYSAMLQFAVLGTLGDILSKWMQQNKIFFPYKWSVLLLKMIEWAIIAVTIKYAFVGFKAFVSGLENHHLIPKLGKLAYAFAVSASMNLQYGLFLVLFHRFLDNLIARQNNWKNIDKSMFSLVWFWIPAHTITFMLARPYQIGLAALWSVVLGIILGFYNKSKN